MLENIIRKSALVAATLMIGIGSSHATTVTISTSDGLVSPGRDNQGWWGSNVSNSNPTNDNYLTSEPSYRSYFTFDLSGVTGTVLGATLELRRYGTTQGAILELFDVNTSAVDLAQRNTVDNAIFADLGTGTSYGSFVAGAGSSSDVMSFSLNAAAFADINGAIGGYFSIGGTSVNGAHFSGSGSEPGNGGLGFTQQLVLITEEQTAQIPEPGALVILGFGLAGLGVARRKRAA